MKNSPLFLSRMVACFRDTLAAGPSRLRSTLADLHRYLYLGNTQPVTQTAPLQVSNESSIALVSIVFSPTNGDKCYSRGNVLSFTVATDEFQRLL
ncbi:unnamed protein product [Leptidea sinapis]|uniref:Uncharacterized protein n=1 Tax=Leptidea sinapis TaxID=189913 RepID=A0A5E4QE20_9NEOP|nr:unnamed protein product [Leptidea sinapis]